MDYILYPVWFLAVLVRGNIGKFFTFRTIDWTLLAFVLWGWRQCSLIRATR